MGDKLGVRARTYFSMTQAKLKPLTFADYLNYDDGSDVRYDLLSNGELIPILPFWMLKLRCSVYSERLTETVVDA